MKFLIFIIIVTILVVFVTLQIQILYLFKLHQRNKNSQKLPVENPHLPELEENKNEKRQTNLIERNISKIWKFFAESPKNDTQKNKWMIAHASTIGLQHLQAKIPIPCQDNHAIKSIEDDFGIAVVCDGAGSAKNSHLGSKFVSRKAVEVFSDALIDNDWIDNELPSQKDWLSVSRIALKKIRFELEQYANEENLEVKSLACTVIVLIYLPKGILISHIGDGRAAYQDSFNQWKAILNPHKGDEANQTIFITSDSWLSENFQMKNVPVPESLVFQTDYSAFTLMSDGCESHSFELGHYDEENEIFIENNNPYPKFFNPLKETIKKMFEDGETVDLIQDKWESFLESGTEKLKNEPDDKTLILGVKI